MYFYEDAEESRLGLHGRPSAWHDASSVTCEQLMRDLLQYYSSRWLCVWWSDTPVPAPSTPPSAPEVPAVERARAMCMLLGLSNAREKDISAGALAAARACIRTGEVYLQSAYADGIDSYVRTG